MKVLKVGDIWEGVNYADMINKVLDKHYIAYMPCTVRLDAIKGVPTVAWFVYMDGSVHGTNKDYLWRNIIEKDGMSITEYCASKDKSFTRNFARLNKSVVAFQLDPQNTGKRYKCKFVGVFELENYDSENVIRTYRRVSDTYVLN
jgi:hypothetical protein